MILRTLRWESDERQLLGFDASFSTNRIFRVTLGGLSATIVEDELSAPLHKVYSMHEVERDVREATFAVAAEVDQAIIGFATARYEPWNRRVVLTGLYVLPHHKNRGVGRALVNATWEYSIDLPARCLWIETQNTNFPAIQFYTRMGFTFCGFDTSLYENSADGQSEVAFYFCRFIEITGGKASGEA